MNRKLYKCKFEGCETQQAILSKGLCNYHRNLDKGSVVKRYHLKQQTAKTREKRRNRGALLEVFFRHHLEKVKLSPFCDNCGCRIQGNIANIAHILPKRSSANPEVMDELQNAIYLCASVNGEKGCHERFDSIQGSPQVYLMPCWKKSVDRYLTFKEKVVNYNKYVKVFEEWLDESI